MTLKQKENLEIKTFLNNTNSKISSQRNQKTVELLEEFFSNMKTDDTTNNHDLVEYLKLKEIKFSDKEIKTDLPLLQSKKTSSLQSKLVLMTKQDKVWVYKRV